MDLSVAFIIFQLIMLPLQALFWYGAKVENDRTERLLKAALRSLSIISVTRKK